MEMRYLYRKRLIESSASDDFYFERTEVERARNRLIPSVYKSNIKKEQPSPVALFSLIQFLASVVQKILTQNLKTYFYLVPMTTSFILPEQLKSYWDTLS